MYYRDIREGICIEFAFRVILHNFHVSHSMKLTCDSRFSSTREKSKSLKLYLKLSRYVYFSIKNGKSSGDNP